MTNPKDKILKTKNLNCDKTQPENVKTEKFKGEQTQTVTQLNTQVMTKLNSNCDTILKSNCDKNTKKPKW